MGCRWWCGWLAILWLTKWDAVGGVIGEVDVCLVGGQLGGVADCVVGKVLGW